MDKKKNLLIVNNNLQIGGVQKSLVNLLHEIKDDYNVTLFLFSKTGPHVVDVPKEVSIIEAKSSLKVLGMSLDQVKKTSVKLILSKILYVLLTKILNNKASIALIQKMEPKLSGYDYAISYLHPAPLKRFYGGTNEFVLKRVDAHKKIAFVHCDYTNYGGDLKYSKSLYANYDNIVFCSQGCAKSFESLSDVFSQKSTVIYNCHNYDEIIRLSNQSPVIYGKNSFDIVMVSRLSYEKGIDIAFAALKECVDKYKLNINLHVVGDGINKYEFKKLSITLGLQKNIEFYGNQKNPYRYMKNADLLLLTSRHEAAPMVFGEAQALGLPILATKTTSSTELVVSKGAGWECTGSITDIVKALRCIFDGNLLLDKSANSQLVSGHNHEAITQFHNMIKRLDR